MDVRVDGDVFDAGEDTLKAAPTELRNEVMVAGLITPPTRYFLVVESDAAANVGGENSNLTPAACCREPR